MKKNCCVCKNNIFLALKKIFNIILRIIKSHTKTQKYKILSGRAQWIKILLSKRMPLYR